MNISLLTAGLVLAVSFTGCAGTDEPTAPTETVTVSNAPEDEETIAPEPKDSGNLSDADYADFMRSEIPELSGVPDETILENSRATCDALDAGLTFDDLFEASIDSGLSPDVIGGLIGGAVAYMCPEHEDILS